MSIDVTEWVRIEPEDARPGDRVSFVLPDDTEEVGSEVCSGVVWRRSAGPGALRPAMSLRLLGPTSFADTVVVERSRVVTATEPARTGAVVRTLRDSVYVRARQRDEIARWYNPGTGWKQWSDITPAEVLSPGVDV